jgi:hypothetical protein
LAPHLGTTSSINNHPSLPPCRQLRAISYASLRKPTVAPRLDDDGMLAVSTRPLRRATLARPEALAGLPPRRKRNLAATRTIGRCRSQQPRLRILFYCYQPV